MKKIILIVVLLGVLQWWFTDPSVSVPTNDISFNYIVKYTGNGGSDDKLPLLIALHGNADTPQNFYVTALNQLQQPARIILLEGPLSMGTGAAWPWTAADFSYYGKAINEAIVLLAEKFPTSKKPILLGFSGGGSMAYYQALRFGNSFSYVFPVSGHLTENVFGNNRVQTAAPVYAYHGTKDNVLSISGGRKAVKLLKSKGAIVKMTEFDGGHLGIFKNMKSEITSILDKKLFSLTY